MFDKLDENMCLLNYYVYLTFFIEFKSLVSLRTQLHITFIIHFLYTFVVMKV